jgi:hypothetical protein
MIGVDGFFLEAAKAADPIREAAPTAAVFPIKSLLFILLAVFNFFLIGLGGTGRATNKLWAQRQPSFG